MVVTHVKGQSSGLFAGFDAESLHSDMLAFEAGLRMVVSYATSLAIALWGSLSHPSVGFCTLVFSLLWLVSG